MGVRVQISGPDPLVRASLAQGLSAAGIDVVEREAEIRLHDLGPIAGSPPDLPTADTPLIVLTVDHRAARIALQSGAGAVLWRDGRADRIVAAIPAVLGGLRAVDDAFSGELFGRPEGRPRSQRPLSAREREVIDLLAAGRSNKEIASRLDISEHTAKFHVNTVLEKLGAHSRTDAVVRAVRTGQVSL